MTEPRARYIVLLGLLPLACCTDVLLTPDQQGARLFDAGEYAAAAERFEDPMRRGVALYRAGQFELAAAAFVGAGGHDAAFNRGNALVLLGRYDDAIDSYDRALGLRPGWPEAIDNRAIAAARKAKLAPPEDDAGGTGGMLGADEIVFDDAARNASAEAEVVEAGAGDPLSDAELRALWLRRVETEPADFLRAKFAYQRTVQQRQPERSPEEGR